MCDSSLHAVDHANLRGSAAYIASGVGACQCRHMLVRPGSVGDLQKGERCVLCATYDIEVVLIIRVRQVFKYGLYLCVGSSRLYSTSNCHII